MELFIFRHAEYERLYNCTGLDIGTIPLAQRQFVPETIAMSTLCAIYYVLYMPCLYSILKHLRDNSCYKLLLYIAINDLGILWIIGFFSTWLDLQGAVFCSYPSLNYFVGIIVNLFWVAESTADLVLAFNRCLEISSPHYSNLLFSRVPTSLWLIGCTVYALYWAVFIPPAVYSSVYNAWFFYPFIGYRNDDQHEFDVWQHNAHNLLVAILSPGIYLIFAVTLSLRIRESPAVISQLNSMQIKTFLQVFLVSALNTLASSIYVYLQYNESHQWLITVAQFAWLHVHGFPPVIYLALNKTIRDDCRLLYMKLFQRRHRIERKNGVTVLVKAVHTCPQNIASSPL
ncbi:hypothetical protein niasHT_036538 [Heterodera trifolii]|uniref:Uncharacterized protein n=1 Tax=Heterodera trifolii TaxID=157864 RepID=A0ABD2IN83_9BILA